MLAELGRRADVALTRGTDAAHEAAHVTVLQVRRIAGALAEAVLRVKREADDLVWDYQDVAADLRREDSAVDAPTNLGRIDLRRKPRGGRPPGPPPPGN